VIGKGQDLATIRQIDCSTITAVSDTLIDCPSMFAKVDYSILSARGDTVIDSASICNS
jgi:hypothetical protein